MVQPEEQRGARSRVRSEGNLETPNSAWAGDFRQRDHLRPCRQRRECCWPRLRQLRRRRRPGRDPAATRQPAAVDHYSTVNEGRLPRRVARRDQFHLYALLTRFDVAGNRAVLSERGIPEW